MSRPRTPRPKYRYVANFGTDDTEEISLIELERAALRKMAWLLEHPAATEEMRERGEELLEELARRLTAEKAARIGSAIGTQQRRAAGDRKAEIVKKELAEGRSPSASPRQVRRIRKRKG